MALFDNLLAIGMWRKTVDRGCGPEAEPSKECPGRLLQIYEIGSGVQQSEGLLKGVRSGLLEGARSGPPKEQPAGFGSAAGVGRVGDQRGEQFDLHVQRPRSGEREVGGHDEKEVGHLIQN